MAFAAELAGVPGFEDGVGVLLRPVDGDGGAVEEDDDHGFAGGGDLLEHGLLGGGEFDVGAIAAGEAFDVDGHLFAFELGGETDHGDDEVGRFGGGDGLGLEDAGGGNPFEGDAAAEEGSGVGVGDFDGVGFGVGEVDGEAGGWSFDGTSATSLVWPPTILPSILTVKLSLSPQG